MQPIRYADLVFQPDMLSAQRDDGTMLRFTRQERALLLRLARQPDRLVTRLQLLNGLGDQAGDLNERNIDYLINRLRKRLGDSARAPRFIATQYGEGYVWIAAPVHAEKAAAFLLIGPVFGLADQTEPLQSTLNELGRRLGDLLGSECSVLCMPGWRFDPDRRIDDISYNLEISLLPEEGHIHIAAMLREGESFKPLAPFRLTLSETAESSAQLQGLAASVCQAIWSHAALPENAPATPEQPPLYLRLHDAGLLLTGGSISWRENAQRLEREHAQHPDDPALSVMLALNRYAQLLQAPVTPGEPPIDDERWQAIEDEMESLALDALPKAQGVPMLLFGIAKVLFFIDRDHLPLAQRLTDEAFKSSTAFATAFAMKGQIEASLGEIDRALTLYDRAIELAGQGSQFHIYLLILKSTALMAADQRGAVEQIATELYALDPAIRLKLGLFFVSPYARLVPPAIQSMLASLGPEQACALMRQLHRVSARQFRHAQHQKNVLRGPAVHLAERLGAAALPQELLKRFPGLGKRPARGKTGRSTITK